MKRTKFYNVGNRYEEELTNLLCKDLAKTIAYESNYKKPNVRIFNFCPESGISFAESEGRIIILGSKKIAVRFIRELLLCAGVANCNITVPEPIVHIKDLITELDKSLN